ncbi:DUF4276 family protein [Streptomyces fructofermentans]|uniref:DUF4276 family protein n=1 Tax=Streptomyces fructofermentans TaxID=152141 RepID=A0A918NTZ7_9ACTN|nr:DUF4276 family protein [Streptomyces fructofermentans]GGX94413.1 hypothetical protein GCM10010515_71600 [Streptomyces fructofermentans]
MSAPYPVIASIVEGHGEERALLGLLQRIVPHLLPGAYADIQRPHRVPRDRMLKRDPLAQALTVVTARSPRPTGVLVLLDTDDDCALELVQRLRGHAQATHAHVPLVAVAAVREFEAWFLAGATGLAGHFGLPDDLAPPSDPEAIRGAKEWISRRMPPGATYQETAHQPSFAQRFDLDAARSGAPSFDKFCRDVLFLLTGERHPRQ